MLACAIVDAVRRIARAINVPLSVRVGVHSGTVTAAFLGTLMPRYFIFGLDVNITSFLETTCEPDMVHVSGETASMLCAEWGCEEREALEFEGQCVQGHMIRVNDAIACGITVLRDAEPGTKITCFNSFLRAM
eukprot:CAMPEP_0206246138 /NCGR_PEP_ID=MMETSP0047_2-20121206/19085_1 /ASSEMBLY_ACC=CAM_ASM_000192 /TAXON_ID=195065 /ORGANISM="Chroomonas mesostigmatica_cf, Strain CCMP1168" /LENGTH=132 /DNA_ID=CAMNT_0053671513 /DNA_START=95 /DNA_END=490 /DNA_ORIENTATION=+